MDVERKFQILKFIGLFVGFIAKFATGSIFVFNVYQDAIKETFNYTQTEVELLSSMLNVGLGVGFVPGMFYDRFGPTMASGVGLLISVPTFILIWSTTKFIEFYSTKAWLMSIYFLLCGFGSVFTYMVALNTNVINFHHTHTGKIVGFLNAFFAGSPSVFATLYYNLFTVGDPTVVANQDFAGFMIFFAILYFVADILCMVFLRVYKKPMDEDITITYYKENDGVVLDSISAAVHDIHKKATETDINLEKNDNLSESLTLQKLLVNVDFHAFSWMFAFAASVGLVYGNNITVASKSVGLDYYNDKLVIIIPITNAVVSALIGIISDYFKERVPRLTILIGACVAFVISQTLVIILAETLALFVIATVFAGIGVGVLWSLSPTIMKETFAVEHLGRNWGIALLLSAMLAFASQVLFGALYDQQLVDGEGTFCYGIRCIRNGYIVFLCVAVVSFSLGIFIFVRSKCCNQRYAK